MQVEVHDWRATPAVLKPLEAAGLRIFHAEENFRRMGCFEYALVRNDWHPLRFVNAGAAKTTERLRNYVRKRERDGVGPTETHLKIR